VALLFIVAYFYVGVARNWSQKRRTSPKGQTLRPKAENKVNFLGIGAGRRGAAPEANAFCGLKPPKIHILSINIISFTTKIYNALHMQGQKGDVGILRGAWLLCPPP